MSPPPSTTTWRSLPSSNSSNSSSSNSGSVNKGKTALHITAERGNLRIAQFLLANEVDVDVADAEGRTALH
jgi:ankyrin repeat protein